jgi:hypothetical protein
MNKEILKQLVKEHFNLVEAPEVSEVKFGEIKDINGAFTVKFEGDVLEVGKKVTIVTAEGQEMDAPDGTHELEDGTKIVTVDSVVTEIMPKEEPIVAEEEMEETIVEEIIEEVKPEMPSVEDIVSAVIDVVKEEMKKYEDKMKALETKMSEFASLPASEKTLPKEGKMKTETFSAINQNLIDLVTKQLKSKKTK